MDPLSALSVAAAAMQFLDFGTRLITDASRIYRLSTGRNSHFVELSRVAADLSILAADIDANMQVSNMIGPDSSRHSDSMLGAESEQILSRLCRECKMVEAQLQTAMGEARAQGTTKLQLVANSLSVALKGKASAKLIADLKERLHETRQQLTIALLVVFW